MLNKGYLSQQEKTAIAIVIHHFLAMPVHSEAGVTRSS